MPVERLTAEASRLCLEDYFTGQTRAWGMFEDRFGKLRRQFEVDAEGSWDGRTLTLVETFDYSDGESERRTWHIEKIGESGYRSRADGMIGQAEGRVADNALAWHYDFSLAVGDKTWRVRLDDWIVRLNDDVLLYRSKVSKFGIRLGQVTMIFLKQQEPTKAERMAREAGEKPSARIRDVGDRGKRDLLPNSSPLPGKRSAYEAAKSA